MAKSVLKLDSRLEAIADMVRPGARCADIGTDHGYLITWLALHHKIPCGYACDINPKPLDKAAFTLSEHKISPEMIQLICCDGLSGIDRDMVDDIVIAGMGGELIWQIISAQNWTKDSELRFILQPMTKAHQLRIYLAQSGFSILRETGVAVGTHTYSVMQVAYTGKPYEPGLFFSYMGNLQRDDPGAIAYARKIAAGLHKKIAGLQAAKADPADYAAIQALLNQLESEWIL